jgi:hypothetical protein
MGTPQATDFLSQRAFRTAGFSIAIVVGLVAAWPHLVVAQSPPSDSTIRVGDLWIYDTKNEVTGFPAQGYTEMIARVSPKEVIVNRTLSPPILTPVDAVLRRPQNSLFTYDHDWDLIDDFLWKFKPNDGLGVRLPLSVGKTWQAEFDAQDLHTTRRIYRGTSSSKVVAQETIATDAGTFDTFKIEQQARWLDPTDPARMWEYQIESWFAPELQHWVRRTTQIKFEKRVRENTTEELANFIKKP